MDNNLYPPLPIIAPPMVPLLPPRNNVYPIMSFKSFMQTQSEDLPPDVFQKRYDEYNLEYINEFSNSFFNASKSEEWFQDRYNPLNIIKIERETCEWAKSESLNILNSIKERSEETIKAMSLEPIDSKPKQITSTTEEKEKEESTEENETPVKEIEIIDTGI